MHLFLFQHEADIDHLAPIVFSILRRKKGSVVLVSSNPNWHIQDDYRVKYLVNTFDVRCLEIEDFGEGFKWSLLKIIRKFLYSLPLKRISLYRTYLKTMYIGYKTNFLTIKVLRKFLEKIRATSITIDFSQPKSFIANISAASRERGIPLIIVNCAPNAYLNEKKDYYDGLGRLYWTTEETFAWILEYSDHLILLNRWGYQPNLLERSDTRVFGAPRFSKEWMEINKKLMEKSFAWLELPQAKNRLKIVIFTRPNLLFDREHNLVRTLVNRDDLITLVKDKPRIIGKQSDYEKEQINKLPSSRLIEWADVVVSPVTSILFDALQQNKVVMQLNYLCPYDRSEFEEYGACHVIKSEEHLFESLNKLIKNRDYKFYSDEAVQKFVLQSINDGRKDEDILANSYNFYHEIESTMDEYNSRKKSV